jgi:hypothetical protein
MGKYVWRVHNMWVALSPRCMEWAKEGQLVNDDGGSPSVSCCAQCGKKWCFAVAVRAVHLSTSVGSIPTLAAAPAPCLWLEAVTPSCVMHVGRDVLMYMWHMIVP